ncbi:MULTISPECIES: FMN-binding negative transcriptional regulator [Pseudoalteromonas]|uniref:FMN-binding negative transcriptional regulator n=1 Tax=Pseudoalteromonas TaxID=53246 RepID=UPI001109D3AD|nr:MULTISPECIES: FMN-binding negative transcriptional regulator [Pseudoalteromonas]MCG9760327.1 FMN-binding negative transcriptional regulator [Pseudoalteromonas sp. Isolate6]NKC21348.1 transcriptional regulator [Pseudoalteromonas galatheae]
MSYPRNYYVESNPNILSSVITKHPLATLTVIQKGKLKTVFVPLTLSDDHAYLLGHATKDNPIFHTGGIIQAIFHCEDHYLSPAVISDIKLPTWLYANVIVEGELALIATDVEKYASMQAQITHFEQFSNSDWQLDNVPANQRQSLFNAINFFKIKINSMHGAFKLSQNQSSDIRALIKTHLTPSKPILASYVC